MSYIFLAYGVSAATLGGFIAYQLHLWRAEAKIERLLKSTDSGSTQ
jgi:uncharacterized membrane protein